MRKSFFVNCLLIPLIAVLIGCKATDKTEETTTSSQTNTANVEPKPEGQQIQYMAVCTDTSHGGNEYVLTKWLDSKDKALVYGREHERKRKGHVVKYNERVKPEPVKH
jgi:hypothetical protein